MGDGVNIAARLEGIAEPGGLCLSSAASSVCRTKSSRARANALVTQIEATEARRTERASNPDAMDLYFQAFRLQAPNGAASD